MIATVGAFGGGDCLGVRGNAGGGFGSGVGEGGIAQAVAEGIKRLFGQVAVGAVGHAVVGEWGELGYGLIKGYRKTAGGIVGTGEDVGYGGAAFFTGIPGIEDGGGVLIGPVDGDGAAVGEDDDQGFAGGGESLEELLLGGREIDVGAIAAEKAGIGVVAFFTFEGGRFADDGDDHIGFAGGGDGFFGETWRNPEKARERFAEAAEIFELDGIRVAGLKMDERREAAMAALPVVDPIIDEEFAVEVEAIAAVGGCADAVVAVNGRDEVAGPADGVAFDGNARAGRDVVGEEIDIGIDAGKGRRSIKYWIREILS